MLNWRLENAVPAALPGNPGLIKQFADRYDRMSEALNAAVEELSNLANEGVSISLAVDEVRERAQESIGVTRKVAVRYQGASQTLNSYQDALDDAIQSAAAARNTISTNNPSAGYWRRRERDLELQRLIDPTNNTLIEDLKEANRWVTEYDNEYLSAIQSYNAAVTARDNAVNAAIAGLDSAADRADLNDGFWERIEGAFDALYDLAQKYLAPVLKIIREALEFIKQIVDVLALIVSILAIFIPVLAPLAGALALASILLSVAVLLCSLALFALGKESLGRVLSDVFNVAISVVTSIGPLRALGGLGQSMSQIGAGGVKMLGQTAAVHFSLAFRMGGETALKSAGLVLGEYAEMVGVEFATEYGEALFEANDPGTPNFSSQGPAWSDPNADPGGFDFAPEKFGESIVGGLSLGFNDIGAEFTEPFTNSVAAGVEFASAANSFSAVPAG
jgi:hypothetical protein